MIVIELFCSYFIRWLLVGIFSTLFNNGYVLHVYVVYMTFGLIAQEVYSFQPLTVQYLLRFDELLYMSDIFDKLILG